MIKIYRAKGEFNRHQPVPEKNVRLERYILF